MSATSYHLEEPGQSRPWKFRLLVAAVVAVALAELHFVLDRTIMVPGIVLSVVLVLAIARLCYRAGRRAGQQDGESLGALVGYVRGREDACNGGPAEPAPFAIVLDEPRQ